jgi:hypothetical protein
MHVASINVANLAAKKEFANCEVLKKNKNKLEWNYPMLTYFFSNRGYFLYRNTISRYSIIRIIDNIVVEVGKKDLKDELLNYILAEWPGRKDIHQYALKNIAKAVFDEFIETFDAKHVEFRKDRPDAMQLYFQNCIVKITATGVTTHEYKTLNGYIWESQILPREYEKSEISPDGDWCRFVSNICKGDQARVNAMCSSLGFYLHNYKSAAYCPAIILNDEVISDNPEGGTGKGLFFRAISYYVKTFRIDGKIFSFDKTFLYQGVSPDTKLIFFDDVKKNFDFERLFSVITEGITTEKKGKDEVYIDFDDSPKIGVSTNYTLKGTGNSHDRRKHELEITQYYTKKFRPDQEFKRMMFTGWNKANGQWVQFDNYMIMCAQLHLAKGLIEQDFVNLPEKKLIAQTNSDFIKFIRSKKLDFAVNTSIIKYELIRDFMDEYEDYIIPSKFFSKHLFTKWLTIYADNQGFIIGDYSDGTVRYYTFKPKPTQENQ